MAETKAKPEVQDDAANPQPGEPVTEEPAEQPEPATLYSGTDPKADSKGSQSITWTASEFIAHDKSTGWYVTLTASVLLLAAIIYFLTKDKISVSVVVIAGLLIGIYGARKPRQLEYRIDKQGVGIGLRRFSYDEFRSFSVVPEGAFSSIVFMPLKRFALPVTIYYAPDDEEKIIAVLSDRLPFETYRHDAVDSLMRHIRF